MPAIADRRSFALTPHAAGVAPPATLALSLTAHRAGDLLKLQYRLQGELHLLRLPEAGAARRADRLWEHCCFELFAGAAQPDSYAEFNFSPSLLWAAYGFAAYREPDASLQALLPTPQIAVARTQSELLLDANLDLARLHAALGPGTLRFAGTAVLETTQGQLSYWATSRQAGARPDFHRADSFTLALSE